MSEKKIKIIIILLSVCLAIIIAFQIKWISNAYQIKKEQFDRSINEAISIVVRKMQGNEIGSFMDAHYNNNRGSYFKINYNKKNSDSFVVDEKEQIEKKIDKIIIEYYTRSLPLQQRVNIKEINDLLKEELNSLNIYLHYEFAIKEFAKFQYPPSVKNINKTLKSNGFTEVMIDKSYSTDLFPRDILTKPGCLLLYFPDKNDYIFKSIWLMLLGSFLFSLIIIISFVYTVYFIFKQKKVSDIKNDFINNMTHEFKTPIATISLASDAIMNHKVINDEIQIKQFIKIIKEENKRMNSHVEQVLQMALLDKKDFDLNLELVDIHELINNVVNKIRLQVDSRNGKIQTEFNANQTFVNGDKIHLLNVFLNLVDNAIKYSEGAPIITVKTVNMKNNIKIFVADKGIGMSKEHITKIFDKFYRVSKGNIHNVKGFGLGLSYVKAIVMAHNGNIDIKSDLGKGSIFEVTIPFSNKNS